MMKNLSKLGPEDIALLKADIEETDCVMDVAKDWKICFGSLVDFIKSKRIIVKPGALSKHKVVQLAQDTIATRDKIVYITGTDGSVPVVANNVKRNLRSISGRMNAGKYEELFHFVQEGKTADEISEEYGISRSCVYNNFAKEDVIERYYSWCKKNNRSYVSIFKNMCVKKRKENAILERLQKEEDTLKIKKFPNKRKTYETTYIYSNDEFLNEENLAEKEDHITITINSTLQPSDIRFHRVFLNAINKLKILTEKEIKVCELKEQISELTSTVKKLEKELK